MLNKLIFYSFLGFIIFYLLSKISYKLNLVDIPNKRSIHNKPVVFTGGIILSIIYLFSDVFFNLSITKLNLILSVGFLIAIVGFIDDKIILNAGGKLSLQCIPIAYLVFLENFQLYGLGNYEYFTIQLNSFSIPFTILSVIFLINAINYFDGSDGTLGFSFMSTLCILYFLISDENIKFFIIILLIPLVIFLFFNFGILKLPKIFLGDSGSLMLGFIISFFLIFLYQEKLVHPILIAWSISIFVYEFLTLNILRLQQKRSIFSAGQDHLHHILLRRNKSKFLTNFYIVLLNVLFFTLGYISFLILNSLISLILFFLTFMLYFYFRVKYAKNTKQSKIKF